MDLYSVLLKFSHIVGKNSAIFNIFRHFFTHYAMSYRWITINYSNIAYSMLRVFDVDKDGRITKNDVSTILYRAFRILTIGLPSSCSFTYGFSLGLKLHSF